MTNVKISSLPTANTIADSTVLVGNVSGATSKFDMTVVKDYLGPIVPLNNANVWSTQNQTISNASEAQVVTYTNSDITGDITVDDGSKITLNTVGRYLFTFSAVTKSTAGTNKVLTMWFRKNNSDVSNSATKVAAVNNASTLMTVTYVLSCDTPGDYYELWMHGDSTSVQLVYDAAGTSPVHPASPSIIVTVNQIS